MKKEKKTPLKLRPLAEIGAIRNLQRQVDEKIAAWLSKRGWSHTSSTPTYGWMWMVEWEGKTLLVDQSKAVSIQMSWDTNRDATEHPEDYGG